MIGINVQGDAYVLVIKPTCHDIKGTLLEDMPYTALTHPTICEVTMVTNIKVYTNVI